MGAERTLDGGTPHRMVHVRRMYAVLQATHAVALRLSCRRGTGEQRQRCGEQCDDHGDGLGATHRG